MIERAFPAPALDPVALLVDAENMSVDLADALLAEAARFGVPTVRRAYGNAAAVSRWHLAGFRPVQTYPGKNAADLLLCVEAMHLALRDAFHTIIIASSDCDFAYVHTHLRELGHCVVGMGEPKTPSAFRAACSTFVELVRERAPQAGASSVKAEVLTPKALPGKHPNAVVPVVRAIIARSNRADGAATLAHIVDSLARNVPALTPSIFGYADWDTLLKAAGYFRFTQRPGRDLVVHDPFRKPKPVVHACSEPAFAVPAHAPAAMLCAMRA